MPINSVVFQGPVNTPGIWYGKIEQRNNQKTLVLFKARAERSLSQKMKDKIEDIHRGEKLATQFITGNHIKITSPVGNVSLLNQYLSSGMQNHTTLSNVAGILENTTKDVNGHVNLAANLISNVSGTQRNITISWEP